MEVINISKRYFNESKPKVSFYHYTSPEAMVNILEKSSLRFTNCMFLNDMEV